MNYCPACRAFVPEGSQLCPTCSSMLTSGSWKDRFLGWLAKVLVQFAPIRRIEVSNSQTGRKRTLSSVRELPPEMRAVIEGDAEIETISLEDAPPEVRARIEEAESLPEGGTVYVGPDGKRRVFRVLDDAPPDIQRKIRELRRRAKPGEVVRTIRVGEPTVRVRTSTRRAKPEEEGESSD